MPRQPRNDIGGQVYHVINRSNNRVPIFNDEGDYQLLENVLFEAQRRLSMPILAYCNMPNHLHFVLYPRIDGQLSKFMHWFTTTFTQRWHAIHNTAGTGHLFQGRYKSFYVEDNRYLFHLLQYVERNPLRARLVKKAEQWRWSSLWIRIYGTTEQKRILSSWPIDLPVNYLELVNGVEVPNILERIRLSVVENIPLGTSTAKRHRGRPKKGA